MKVPHFKNKFILFVVYHKKVIFISMIISFALIYFGGWAIQARDKYIADMNSTKKETTEIGSNSTNLEVSSINIEKLTTADLGVLGASDSAEYSLVKDTSKTNDYAYTNVNRMPTNTYTPMPTSIPIPTNIPYPTSIPYISSTPVPDCAGTPTAYNSNAIVSATATAVNDPVTIIVELRDCHNNFAQVSDNLNITLSNNNGTARINGINPPINVQTQNGKVSFTVNSQINITDTYIITDTTRQFRVTDPHNRNPSVTYINNSEGNTNCTTKAGEPNFWYSLVSPPSTPSSPVDTPFTFQVAIKDCEKNIVSSDEPINITMAQGDSSTTVNGHGLPFSTTAHSGQINLTVNSQKTGIVTIVITNKKHSFNITDKNNQNPSINFTSITIPSNNPTPTFVQTSITTAISQTPTHTTSPTVVPTTSQPHSTQSINPSPT